MANRGGVCALIALAACGTTEVIDLGVNERFYQSPGYRAKIAADRAVSVLPMVDARKPRAAEASGPYAMRLMPEGMWARPVPSMFDEILREEIQGSGVFTRVEPSVEAKACLLRPTLETFEAGVLEHPGGRSTFAEILIRIEIYGPVGADGKRDRWFDHRFAERQASDVSMSPIITPVLSGMVLRSAMAKMLAAIDQSNVGRTAVPLHLGR